MPKAQAPPLVNKFESWEIAAEVEYPYEVLAGEDSDEEVEEHKEEAAPKKKDC